MWNKLFFTIACLLITFIQSKAQDNDDSELWTTASLTYGGIKKLDLNASFSARFKNNWSTASTYNSSFGLSYKLSKKLKTAFIYRYSYKIKTYENRIAGEIKWSDELKKRTDLSIRSRYQVDFLLSETSPENTLRNKIELTHRIKKTKLYPTIYTELFTNLNRFESSRNSLRLGFAIDYQRLKNQTISLGFFKNFSSFIQNPNNRNIFTIDYKIKIK
jgi:hypothetical protein